LPDGPIVIVEAVVRELEKYAPEILNEVAVTRASNPQVIPTALAQWNLDDGERNALAHALFVAHSQPVLLLCDDTRARKAAAALNLEVTGTIGLLIQSAASGNRSKEEVMRRWLPCKCGEGYTFRTASSIGPSRRSPA
jgi:predicted nucleic acid-binding protein